MFFDMMLSLVNEIFGGVPALFDPAFRRGDTVLDCVHDGFFDPRNSRLELSRDAT
jgi:hypothetical protein